MSMDATGIESVPADELSAGILVVLAAEPGADGVSLPRLGKQLGVGVSVLMRRLALMGDARIGTGFGPGWVRVTREGERWMAVLTEAGQAFHAENLA